MNIEKKQKKKVLLHKKIENDAVVSAKYTEVPASRIFGLARMIEYSTEVNALRLTFNNGGYIYMISLLLSIIFRED